MAGRKAMFSLDEAVSLVFADNDSGDEDLDFGDSICSTV
jgi:hypothetical protein